MSNIEEIAINSGAAGHGSVATKPAETKKMEGPQPTARPELDKALARLRAAAPAFARSSVTERIALARKFLDGYVKVADESVEAGCKVKGIDPSSPLAAEVVGFRETRALLMPFGPLEGVAPGAEIRIRPEGASVRPTEVG